MSQIKYTGHGKNTGGLQGHSIGELYPWTIVGYQATPEADVVYYGFNTHTGAKTPSFQRAKQAGDAIREKIAGERLRATLRLVTGHQLP